MKFINPLELFDYKSAVNELIPYYCVACNGRLQNPADIVCGKCLASLPKTGFLAKTENPVAELFWGRIYLQQAASVFYFDKVSSLQAMLHALKYDGFYPVGHILGNLAGKEMLKHSYWQNIDFLVPVPLHPDKEKMRGYNQSEKIAKGISEQTQISLATQLVFREKFTESQTRKSKSERWENMQNVFKLAANFADYENKHLLLIDDVLTTGATLEAVANCLSGIRNIKLSVLTIAFAHQ